VSLMLDQLETHRVLTPCGKYLSQIFAPPFGTTRASGNPVAGCILRPSLIHACKYGILWASENEMILFGDAFPDLFSSTSARNYDRLVRSRQKNEGR
jgi:hypothetical protein